MKLAVSNIAWPPEHNESIAKLLAAEGATGIEIAPSKLWPRPLEVSDAQIDECRQWWTDRGLPIVAAQALLFGKTDLRIFDDTATRDRTRDYLAQIIRICARLGAEALVFGSPRNRAIGQRTPAEVHDVSVEFFRDLGTVALESGTHVVLEAIPHENGADYILTAADALSLVRDVDHPGFRLHLDAACMALAGDPIESTLQASMPYLRHFHISEPALAAIGSSGRVDHVAIARELHRLGYAHKVSIEMRDTDPFDATALAASLRFVREVYG